MKRALARSVVSFLCLVFVPAAAYAQASFSGIVKDTSAALIKNEGDAGHFAYIATYGKQSLNASNCFWFLIPPGSFSQADMK